MSQEIVLGKIIDIKDDGTVIINTTVPNIDRALTRKYKNVLVGFEDGRRISSEQRRKCFALIGEIAEYVEGYKTSMAIEETKEMLKMDFVLHRMQAMERKMFSLSDVSMSTASEFITYLIEFIIKNDIPTKVSLLEHCEDIGRYVLACLYSRKCCVCGKHADIHHIDRVGMGNDRNEIHNVGRRALPLCREHHMLIHNDERGFLEKYHLEPIALDEKLCKKLHLKP